MSVLAPAAVLLGEWMRARRLMRPSLLGQWSSGMVAVRVAGSNSQPGTIEGISTVAVTVTSSPP